MERVSKDKPASYWPLILYWTVHHPFLLPPQKACSTSIHSPLPAYFSCFPPSIHVYCPAHYPSIFLSSSFGARFTFPPSLPATSRLDQSAQRPSFHPFFPSTADSPSLHLSSSLACLLSFHLSSCIASIGIRRSLPPSSSTLLLIIIVLNRNIPDTQVRSHVSM